MMLPLLPPGHCRHIAAASVAATVAALVLPPLLSLCRFVVAPPLSPRRYRHC
jgi:hypothetical protein